MNINLRSVLLTICLFFFNLCLASDPIVNQYVSDSKHRTTEIRNIEIEINQKESFEVLQNYHGDRTNLLFRYYQLLALNKANLDIQENELTALANLGLSAAIINLGVKQLSGDQGFEKNVDKAFVWFKKAADENNEPMAMILVATLLKGEFGHKENIDEAWAYINRAKSLGEEAYVLSAITCMERQTSNLDTNKNCNVISDFKTAISLGHLESELNLVKYKMFFSPNKEDTRKEGLRELIDLANDGNAEAQTLLGQLHEHGYDELIKKDKESAMGWYKKAVKQNSPDAQISLARMLFDGLDSYEELQIVEDLIISAASSGKSEYIEFLLKFYKNYSEIKPEYLDRITHIENELNL